ncbi:MAG: hypothetical protein ACO2PN_28670 [Pyrobaculum sp.]
MEVVGVGRGVGEDSRWGVATRSPCRRRLFICATVADAVVFAEVPTARLSIAAVDDCNEPADIYVERPVAAVDLSKVPRTPAQR